MELRRLHHRPLLPDGLVLLPRGRGPRRRWPAGRRLGSLRRRLPERGHRGSQVARHEPPEGVAGCRHRGPDRRRHPRGGRGPRGRSAHGLQPLRRPPLDAKPVRERRGPNSRGGGPRRRRDPRDRRGSWERRGHAAAQRLRAGRVRAPGLAGPPRGRARLRLGHVQRERGRGRHERRRLQGSLRPHRHPLHHRPRPQRQPAPGERDLQQHQPCGAEGLEPGRRPRGQRGGPARVRELRRRAPAELRGQRARVRGRQRGRHARVDRGGQRLQLRHQPLHLPLPDAVPPAPRPDALERQRLRLDRHPEPRPRQRAALRGLQRDRDRGAEPRGRRPGRGRKARDPLPFLRREAARLLAGQDRARELALRRAFDRRQRRHVPLRQRAGGGRPRQRRPGRGDLHLLAEEGHRRGGPPARAQLDGGRAVPGAAARPRDRRQRERRSRRAHPRQHRRRCRPRGGRRHHRQRRRGLRPAGHRERACAVGYGPGRLPPHGRPRAAVPHHRRRGRDRGQQRDHKRRLHGAPLGRERAAGDGQLRHCPRHGHCGD